MDESTALSHIGTLVDHAGDDAAVVDGQVISIDMLHERTDFPDGVTRYTAGWRAVGATLSDLAAMGAKPVAAVAAYGAPSFDESELSDFVAGAQDVCEQVGTQYVGGDLDAHEEFTVATSAVGQADTPIRRSGANVGERVYVTGALGRTAAAIDAFEAGDMPRGNELFRFEPRVRAGCGLQEEATAMIDSSDGLARSLHQLANASDCGFDINGSRLPIHPSLDSKDDRAWWFGEDFELVFTAANTFNPDDLAVPTTEIGAVTADAVRMDDSPLPDRGYDHG